VRNWFPALACTVLLAACAIPPRTDRPALRDEAPLAGIAADVSGRWPDADWWKRYDDPQLDALEAQALTAAPTLRQAGTRFDAALRAVDIARAEAGLGSSLDAQAQRIRLSEHGLIPPQFLGFTWYDQGDLSLGFRYDFDFWGRTRAAVAAAVDEARAAEAERSAATLMLTVAVADAYLGWQADRAHVAVARDAVAILEGQRRLSMLRRERGIEPPDVGHDIEARLASAREMQIAYEGAAEVRRAAIAALLGIAPAQLPQWRERPLPEVDGQLPDDVGIDLLARRPDIAASRWRVEAALARTEQARAAFFPDVSLGAMIGLQSIDLGKLLEAGSRTAAIGPALHLPLFGNRTLRATHRAAQAQLEAAAAAHDAAVVDAARDVSTQSLALAQLAARRDQRERQLAAQQELARIAKARADRGLGDDRSVLAARADVLEQQDAALTLHAQALSTELALIKALGGGYRLEADPAATDVAKPARTPLP